MYVLTVYLEVEPENIDAFKNEASVNALASSKEPGCLRFDFLQQADQPTKFMLYEVYRDESAFKDEHLKTEHYQRWVEKGVPLLVGDRVRVMYQNIVPGDETWH